MNTVRRTRGFTLIELMIVVFLIGILSSVALPEFQRFTLRARTAERRTIMGGISHAMSQIALTSGQIPALTGDWNPATPMTSKQHLDLTLVGWRDLALQVEGQTYYSYKFVSDPVGTNPLTGVAQPTMDISAVGDLDGDGFLSSKTISYVGYGDAYQYAVETPAEGLEDSGTF
ncbi:MAG TPA: prepilin-type N-terminal cleavage/methylation domain-containing protein [Anaeromyxobacteraceae bacterium]